MTVKQRLAVIDLGSNSFRLVVYTVAGEGWWQRTDEIYQPVRIGEGLAASGRLGDKPIGRALATLEVFSHFCKASGLLPGQVEAVATSAIRDAENSEQVLAPARELIGLPVRVLSREQEAYYGYLAAVNSTTLDRGAVLDLGGGSLQLVHVVGRLQQEVCSWPLGAVRMTERFLAEPDSGGVAQPQQLQALREHVAATLTQAGWLQGMGSRIVGMGGTARNLAAAAQRLAGLPSNGVQGFVVSAQALSDLVERLAALPAKERAKLPGIKPARADLILAGAVVIEGVLAAGGFDGLEVTEAGLREGVFFERHLSIGDPPTPSTPPSPSTPPRPPLYEDVRRAGVLNLARRYGMDAPHSRHVAELALGMFDELAAQGLHAGDPVERELLWSACMLHDIGMSVDYDDHHKHSRYLILNAGLPGFSPTELAVVAQAARYHRKGMPEPGFLSPLFGKSDLAMLDRCAALLRLAEDLERSRDQLVRQASLAAGNGGVRLKLVADGQTAVPRWAAGREGELFQRAFGRRLDIAA
jgi:exopolyphosphatase/guanosine-5'-triphosphate,3'-diphosphate pyrophosphatase